MRRFRYEYGSGPLHALGLAASFALTGYAVLRIAGGPSPLSVLLWFVAAIVAHDLVLLPLYSSIDRIGARVLRPARSPRAISPLNHVRVPALLSGLMLLVWFPLVLGLSDPTFSRQHRPRHRRLLRPLAAAHRRALRRLRHRLRGAPRTRSPRDLKIPLRSGTSGLAAPGR